MAHDPNNLSDEMLAFLRERHLGNLTTMRADGSLHMCAVGFMYDPDDHIVRVITWATSQKARNAARGGRAAVGQVDGGRWLSMEGPVRLVSDPERTALAVSAYAARYREPKQRLDRVALEISVEHVLGRS